MNVSFTLIAQDGNEYGPASPEVLREWMAQNRLNEFSLLRREPDGLKMQAAKFPELLVLFKGPEAVSPPKTLKPTSAEPEKDLQPPPPPEVPMAASLFLLLTSGSLALLIFPLPALAAGYMAWRKFHEAVQLKNSGADQLYEEALRAGKGHLRGGWIMFFTGLALGIAGVFILKLRG